MQLLSAFVSRDASEKVWRAAVGRSRLPPLPAGRYPSLQLFPLSALAEPWEIVTSLLVTAWVELVLFQLYGSRKLSLNSGRLSAPLLGDLKIENRRPGDSARAAIAMRIPAVYPEPRAWITQARP